MARISLIIPTHNRYLGLRITMPYYLRQKGIEEIIIVDDGSNDLTGSYVSSLKTDDHRIKYIRNEKRCGLPHSRNVGIKAASCEYVLMGEDDVIFQDDYGLTLIDVLEKKGADVIGGRLLPLESGESFESCINRNNEKELNNNTEIVNKQIFFGDFSTRKTEHVLFLHACSIFKRNVIEFVQYEEQYRYNYFREETDFYLNAVARGFSILFCGDRVAFHLPKNIRATGGCHHFETKVIALRILCIPRLLASRGLESSILRSVYHLLNFDYDLMSFLNNNYFMDKYFYLLKMKFGLNHGKYYYKLVFVRFLFRQKVLSFLSTLKGLF